MPNIDESAKAWQLEVARRVGGAVKDCRTRQKLTAQQLSERTRELGYPVTRVAISKIESNSRAGKIDLTELLVLAAALGVPPVALLYPDLADGDINLLPRLSIKSDRAMLWAAGAHPLSWELLSGRVSEMHSSSPQPKETQLVQAAWERVAAREELGRLLRAAAAAGEDSETRGKLYAREVDYARQRIEQLNAQIRALGGTVDGDGDA